MGVEGIWENFEGKDGIGGSYIRVKLFLEKSKNSNLEIINFSIFVLRFIRICK